MNWFFKKTDLKKFKPEWPIIIIVILAFLVRLFFLFKIGDFSWDEIFSFTYSQYPLKESFGLWLLETNPPLHLILLKIWFLFFPATEFFSRLPSLLLGVSTIISVYFIGKNFFNKKIGIISAVVLSLMPYHIFLSNFARGYSLLLFLSSLSVYLFLKILKEEKPNIKNYILLSLVNLLAIFTHLTGIFLILSELIIILRKKEHLKLWFTTHLPSALIFFSWIIPSFYLKLKNPADLSTAWFFNFEKSLTGLFTPMKLLFFGPANNYYIIAVIILFIGLFFQEIYTEQKNKKIRKEFLYLSLFFFLPILTAVVLNLWNIKFFVISLPFGCLIFAYLVNKKLKNIFLSLLTIILISIPGIYTYYKIMPLSDWTQLNQTVTSNTISSNQTLIISNNFVDYLLFLKYYQATNFVCYFPTNSPPTSRDIITKNYLHYKRTDKELSKWFKDNNIGKYEQVFILQEDAFGVDLSGFLDNQGVWQKKELNIRLADPRKLYLYEKN